MPGSLRVRGNPGVFREDALPRGVMTESQDVGPTELRAPWFVHLGMPALTGVAVVWCGTIILGFLLGLSFGRHQGIESALEDFGQEAVRVPLPSPAKKEIINVAPDQLAAEQGAGTGEKLLSEGILSKAPSLSLSQGAMSEAPHSLAHPEAELLVGNLPAPVAVAPAKAAAKPEGSAERPTIERNLPEAPTSKWIVQAATFRNKTLANTALKKIQGMKIPVLLDEGQRDGAKYFRVILGPFASSEKATTAKKQVIRSKIVRGELYVKQLASH